MGRPSTMGRSMFYDDEDNDEDEGDADFYFDKNEEREFLRQEQAKRDARARQAVRSISCQSSPWMRKLDSAHAGIVFAVKLLCGRLDRLTLNSAMLPAEGTRSGEGRATERRGRRKGAQALGPLVSQCIY